MSDEMTAMDLCDFYVGSQGRESPMANETVRVNYKDFMAIRTDLAAATERAEKAEADRDHYIDCYARQMKEYDTDLAAMTERAEILSKLNEHRLDLVDKYDTLSTDLAATREKLRVAREYIEIQASQLLPDEARKRENKEYGHIGEPDFEGAYKYMVKDARDTLARLTTQEGEPQ